PSCVTVPAGARALLSPSAPPGIQLAVGVASGLWRTGQSESTRPAWSHASRLPALPQPTVCHLLVYQDLAVVVCRPGPAGFSASRRWPPVSGGRQHPEGQARPQASRGPDDTSQPAPSLRLRLPDRAPHGAIGRLSYPGGFRAGPAYRRCGLQPENALFRQMLQEFQRPAWCQEVVVTADAAYASRANLDLIQELGYIDVVALPRTWKCANGKALKALVTHLPRGKYSQMRIPTVNTQRHWTARVYAKRARLRHLGDVTLVLSTCRRHDGPKQTK